MMVDCATEVGKCRIVDSSEALTPQHYIFCNNMIQEDDAIIVSRGFVWGQRDRIRVSEARAVSGDHTFLEVNRGPYEEYRMNAHSLRYLIACGMLIVSVTPSNASRQSKAFILSGQSNMDGHGPTADMPPELQEPIASVRYYIGGQWHELQPLIYRVGPEISFGRAMAAAWPDEEIAIIKYAVGGTSLLNWDPFWEEEPQCKPATIHKALSTVCS